MSAKFPWDKIKREYIEAPDEASRPTLESLAAKYGCNPAYLRSRASKERWLDQANIFLTKTQQKRQERKSTHLASEQAQFDIECLQLNRALISQIVLNLKRSQEAGSVLKPVDIQVLVRSLKDAQQIGKLALGDEVAEDKSNNVVVWLPDNLRDQVEQLES